MNLQRREEIREMCAEPARGGTQGAKQIFDLRDAINELFAHIDTLEQTAAERVITDGKVPAVVVPPIPYEDAQALKRICKTRDHLIFGALQWAREHARAIPADRVLGEGMRQVDARRFARMQFEEAERPYLLELERYVRAMAKLQNWSKDTTDHGPLSSLDRLRANQGGAAT